MDANTKTRFYDELERAIDEGIKLAIRYRDTTEVVGDHIVLCQRGVEDHYNTLHCAKVRMDQLLEFTKHE